MECFQAIEKSEGGQTFYQCPKCKGRSMPGLKKSSIQHVWRNEGKKDCPLRGVKYCQQLSASSVKSVRPPEDHYEIGYGPERNHVGKCFSHKGKYLGKFVKIEQVGHDSSNVKFEFGNVGGYLPVMVTVVPCQGGGARRSRSKKYTRKLRNKRNGRRAKTLKHHE